MSRGSAFCSAEHRERGRGGVTRARRAQEGTISDVSAAARAEGRLSAAGCRTPTRWIVDGGASGGLWERLLVAALGHRLGQTHPHQVTEGVGEHLLQHLVA